MKFDSLLARIDRLPPCLCRLLARRNVTGGGWAPKSTRDIAADAGLSKSAVAELSRRRTWRGTPIGMADAFARGCGVNLAEVDAVIKRLRYHRTRLRHLSKGNGHQRRMIADLLKQVKNQNPMESSSTLNG